MDLMGTPQHCENTNDLGHALATIGRKAINIEHLEAENASLRAQLSAMPRNDATLQGGNMLFSPTCTPSCQGTSSTNMIPAAQYEDLQRKYAELEAAHIALKGQHDFVRKKWKESKTLVTQWKSYIEQKRAKDAKKRKAGSMSTPPPAETIERNIGPAHSDMDATPRASAAIHAPTRASFGDCEGGTPHISSSPPRLMALPYRTASQIEREPEILVRSQPMELVTSSQTTVNDPETQLAALPPVSAAPSSDFEPIVVSTRCLKRKNRIEAGPESPVRRIKQEPGSPSMPIEFASSSPRRMPKHTLYTTSSDDCLDNFGPSMPTPRRPKRVDDLRLRATSEEVLRRAPRLQRSASSLSDGDVGALCDQSMLPLSESNGDTRGKRVCPGISTATVGLQHPQRQHSHVLKPISGNVPRLQRPPENQSKPRTKARRTGPRDKILLVSEDGDDGFSQNATHSGHPQNVLLRGLPADDRLDDLLNGPLPDQVPVLPRLVAPAEILSSNQNRPSSAQLRTPVSVVKRTSPVKPTTNLRRAPVRAKTPPSERAASAVGHVAGRAIGGDKSPPPVRPEEEPLRIRPVATLRLEDFKINPKYMGTDFAFADTIRGRDARQNLHACTRADCCGGALEKVIRMGGTAMSGRTDAHALEAFIGPAWRALMGGQRPEEAKRLLLQAHAFCFANEHGKHRQAFERRSTPPGYWRADFPTTQEQATDRKTADEMQRKEVEDRHREAMREGGRWMFRDE